MLFSTDEASNKAVIYAGVPPEAPSGFNVLEWLTPSIAPLKGRGGGGKNGLAQGQVSHYFIFKKIVFGQSLPIIIT
jgi:alanyl-tRNA synthetase